jgi:hypothetical protein
VITRVVNLDNGTTLYEEEDQAVDACMMDLTSVTIGDFLSFFEGMAVGRWRVSRREWLFYPEGKKLILMVKYIPAGSTEVEADEFKDPDAVRDLKARR